MKYSALFIILFLLSGCNGVRNHEKTTTDFIQELEKIVLEQNNIDQEFNMEVNDSLKTLECSIYYLGSFQNEEKKLIYLGILSGNKCSPHFNSYLSIYSTKGVKIGSYYISSYEKPKLLNDTLIIKGTGDCNQTTRISLRDSIPKMIFIHCREENGQMFGDIYNFEKTY